MASRRFETRPFIACLKTLLLAYCLIFWATGAILLAVGLWGCFLLGPYLSLMTETSTNAPYVLIATGTIIILFGLFGCSFMRTFQEAVIQYNAQDQRSLAVDNVQRSLRCCGVYNYTSWFSSSSYPASGIPASCCVSFSDCSSQDLRNATLAPSKVHTQGCYNIVTSFIETNMGIIAGVTFGIAFSQLVGMLLACCLYRFISANQYEMV
ncbi:hypothetical protein CRUP_021562 [Coryphaenoides rupestris]|nr:hypothetical protein CRUP_021562 [Coryphaenoides rupestris]